VGHCKCFSKAFITSGQRLFGQFGHSSLLPVRDHRVITKPIKLLLVSDDSRAYGCCALYQAMV